MLDQEEMEYLADDIISEDQAQDPEFNKENYCMSCRHCHETVHCQGISWYAYCMRAHNPMEPRNILNTSPKCKHYFSEEIPVVLYLLDLDGVLIRHSDDLIFNTDLPKDAIKERIINSELNYPMVMLFRSMTEGHPFSDYEARWIMTGRKKTEFETITNFQLKDMGFSEIPVEYYPEDRDHHPVNHHLWKLKTIQTLGIGFDQVVIVEDDSNLCAFLQENLPRGKYQILHVGFSTADPPSPSMVKKNRGDH